MTILHRGQPTVGTIHLTPHHLIFRANPDEESNTRPTEIWITYPIIANVYRNPPSAGSQAHIRLRNRDFMFLMLQFRTDRECREVFESIKSLSVVKSVEKLYAFFYTPGSPERKHNGWAAYDPRKEYERMGVGTDKCKGWRISRINKDYAVSNAPPPRGFNRKLCCYRYFTILPSLSTHQLAYGLTSIVFTDISSIIGSPSNYK